jgi:hypothetical protein
LQTGIPQAAGGAWATILVYSEGIFWVYVCGMTVFRESCQQEHSNLRSSCPWFLVGSVYACLRCDVGTVLCCIVSEHRVDGPRIKQGRWQLSANLAIIYEGHHDSDFPLGSSALTLSSSLSLSDIPTWLRNIKTSFPFWTSPHLHLPQKATRG